MEDGGGRREEGGGRREEGGGRREEGGGRREEGGGRREEGGGRREEERREGILQLLKSFSHTSRASAVKSGPWTENLSRVCAIPKR